MAQTVIGFFDDSSEAQNAVEKLVNYGISRDRIDVSGRSAGSSSSSTTSGSSTTSDSYSTSGSTSGLTRVDHDDNDNGITRFFKNLFGDDDDDADKYSRVASRSQCIVTVHANTNDEAEEAADILDDCGAVDVDERAAQYGYNKSNYSGSDSHSGSTTGSLTGASYSDTTLDTDRTDSLTGSNYRDTTLDTDRTESLTGSNYRDTNLTDNDSSEKLDVIKENIEIGKREVEKGGVRLRSRIVERPVEETIRLREERVHVERTTVDRDATDTDFSTFQEKDIEMVERSEVPVVNKQARVVEEVRLNKEVNEREETIRDTVRNTEVDVENLDKGDVRDRLTDRD